MGEQVKVYEEHSGDKVSENIKLAVWQKYLCNGELARHLNLQLVRRDDVRSGSQESDQLPPSKAGVDGVWKLGSHGPVAVR